MVSKVEHQAERRSAPRAAFTGGVRVRTNDDVRLVCRTDNLSESGMLLRAPRRAEPGARLWLEFALPGLGPGPHKVNAVVARQVEKGGLPALGVRFERVPPAIQQLLARYVAQDSRSANTPKASVRSTRRIGRQAPDTLDGYLRDHDDGLDRLYAAAVASVEGDEKAGPERPSPPTKRRRFWRFF